jgi:hypothetical protein
MLTKTSEILHSNRQSSVWNSADNDNYSRVAAVFQGFGFVVETSRSL